MTERLVVQKVKPAAQRAFRTEAAAAYCGLSIDAFKVLVFHDRRLPAPVVVLGEHLFERAALDAALDRMFAYSHVQRQQKMGSELCV